MNLVKRIAICSFIACLAFIIFFPGLVSAGNSTYSLIEYQCVGLAVVDGSWTTADEWLDSPRIALSDNASFAYNFDMTTYTTQWLIEFFTDNTTDPGDYWQICLDADNSGGVAPQPGDFKIEVSGHSTLSVFEGNGSGWIEVSPAANELTWSNSTGSSPWDSQPHWIFELSDSSKIAGTVQTPVPPNGMRVAVYDASSGELESWAPNSSAEIPDQWGVISIYSITPYPTPTVVPVSTPTPDVTASPAPTATPLPTLTVAPTSTPAPTYTPIPTTTPTTAPDESSPLDQDPVTQTAGFEVVQDGFFVLLIILGETLIFAKSKRIRKLVK
jgi:hypothetical protein